MGSSVNAVRTENKEQVSDVVAILKFLAEYTANRSGSIERIRRVLNEGLLSANGKNLFAGRFAYLNTCGLTPAQIFDETLGTLFNAPGGGALHIENLKGASGEVAVRVGDNAPFGVINVGDDTKLVKLCEANGLNVAEREFAGSLFHELNKPQSTINVLIGSKKFSEGWSSWRVSTLGLMNVGKSEGAQIIQLFGRGVRLKGYGMSLKRSARASLPTGLERPKHIATLETLHIFGVRADYMAQFRDFLEEEGLPTNEERIKFFLPVVKNLGTLPLKSIRLKKQINGVSTEFGDAFRKLGPVPTVRPPDAANEPATAYLQKNPVVLNWYPKIQAMKAAGVEGGDDDGVHNETHLSRQHIAFLNLDQLYFEVERFKAERGWYNLNLTRSGIAELLADTTWYRLQIPESELAFNAFDKVHLWQEIAQALVRKYVERYYNFRKREWELPHLEYRVISEDDPNLSCFVHEEGQEYGYRIVIDQSQEEIVKKLEELKAAINAGDLKPWEFLGLKAVFFGPHLYQPCCSSRGVWSKFHLRR